ncbi:MAG TPA: metallophosphoesterase family protein [Candidatus Limnocylindrales bacterium]|nr:metallophosphoesterase family protein [Candidatus Limnocylindrales bacterium]
MATRIAVLSDMHGNLLAVEAVRKAIKREKPDVILVAGDIVMNGPEPGGTVDALRDMEREGAIIVQGNTDIAVADGDYAAAVPWYFDSGVPESMKAAANWAHDALEDEHLAWLRRLPAERRVRIGDDLILVTHASPGSQTQGFDRDLDPSTTTERMSRTDARVICCGHTHMPEIREFGWKLIVNGGSAGYVFDGDPTASWALVTIDGGGADGTSVSAEIKRTEYDNLAVANAISARGLPGDVYRAATVRTGKLVR